MAILDRQQQLDARLTPDERAGLAAFVDRLRQRYGDDLLRVRLFGSKARGDSHEESDFDLLIVLRIGPGDYRRRWNELVDLAWDIQLAHGIIISFILKDGANYARMQRDGLLLARNIEQDGVDLWTTQQQTRKRQRLGGAETVLWRGEGG
jgi:predicted nucleotidyltransferase